MASRENDWVSEGPNSRGGDGSMQRPRFAPDPYGPYAGQPRDRPGQPPPQTRRDLSAYGPPRGPNLSQYGPPPGSAPSYGHQHRTPPPSAAHQSGTQMQRYFHQQGASPANMHVRPGQRPFQPPPPSPGTFPRPLLPQGPPIGQGPAPWHNRNRHHQRTAAPIGPVTRATAVTVSAVLGTTLIPPKKDEGVLSGFVDGTKVRLAQCEADWARLLASAEQQPVCKSDAMSILKELKAVASDATAADIKQRAMTLAREALLKIKDLSARGRIEEPLSNPEPAPPPADPEPEAVAATEGAANAGPEEPEEAQQQAQPAVLCVGSADFRLGDRVKALRADIHSQHWVDGVVEDLVQGPRPSVIVRFEEGDCAQVKPHEVRHLHDKQGSSKKEEQSSADSSEEEDDDSKARTSPGMEGGLAIYKAEEAHVEWEEHTRGVASKLMAKMGYKKGEALGVRGEGIAAPIPIEVRAGRAGLDHDGEDGQPGGASNRKRDLSSGGGMPKRRRKDPIVPDSDDDGGPKGAFALTLKPTDSGALALKPDGVAGAADVVANDGQHDEIVNVRKPKKTDLLAVHEAVLRQQQEVESLRQSVERNQARGDVKSAQMFKNRLGKAEEELARMQTKHQSMKNVAELRGAGSRRKQSKSFF